MSARGRPPRAVTVGRDDVPKHARCKYILSGYRPALGANRPTIDSIWRGLFTIHNETVNVWSHLTGMLWASWRLRETWFTPNIATIARVAVSIFQLFAAVVLGISASTHLIAPQLNALPSQALWRLDHSAIVLAVAGSFAPGLVFGFRCYPWYRVMYSTAVALGCIIAAYFTERSSSRSLTDSQRAMHDRRRITTLVATSTFGLLPLCHWCLYVGSRDDIQLLVPGLLRMFGLLGAGLFFFMTLIPERLAPGRFDLFPSHALWHLLVLGGLVSWDGSIQTIIRREWHCSDV